MTMENKISPRTVSSRRRIKYRCSEWSVQEFEVWGGGAVCRATALLVQGSVLVWVGAREEPRLGDLALALPAGDATQLLGAGGPAPSLARRLAAALTRPVYVSCGESFDIFTLPLVERALLTQLNKIVRAKH